jgi:hypothetical protein
MASSFSAPREYWEAALEVAVLIAEEHNADR